MPPISPKSSNFSLVNLSYIYFYIYNISSEERSHRNVLPIVLLKTIRRRTSCTRDQYEDSKYPHGRAENGGNRDKPSFFLHQSPCPRNVVFVQRRRRIGLQCHHSSPIRQGSANLGVLGRMEHFLFISYFAYHPQCPLLQQYLPK